ncbi:MAG: Rpp14/Pop5 family protein [Candidatus Heimdallarchaeaceae archaeon]
MVIITRDRYVVVNVITDESCASMNLIKTKVWQTYQNVFGISGSSSAGLYFEHFDEKKKSGIIRCSHDSLSSLLTVLALITKVDGIDVILHPIYVSGVINKAKKYLT